MYYDRPLYPPPGEQCGGDNCVRMPLFGSERDVPICDRCGSSQTVRLENPRCPGECAEVSLSVDHCGNLVICVHRAPPRCQCSGRRRPC